MIYTVIFLLLFAGLISTLVFGGNTKKLKLKIKSIKSGEDFIAEKKESVKGNKFLDWFYYDEDGKSIEDESLKLEIFEAFGNEDWYGDYKFYTNAKTKEENEKFQSSQTA